MALFDKFKQLANHREALFHGGIDPGRVVIERILSPTHAIIDGRETVLFGTNNYLGLTFDEQSIDAGRAALSREGTGTTGSRMANGSYAGHAALERELADFFGRKHCVVFSTGYSANLGVLMGLAGPGDVIIIDADSHASIYDGCRMSGAEVFRFRHDDAADLDRRLKRLGSRASDALIVVEGLYSMLGDRADLARIAAVKAESGAFLVVDEAHSLGVFGATGRGVAEEAGVEAEVDFVVGTFSKSLGTTGGYCVSNHDELELLRYSSRPFVFTASPCPSVVACTRAALTNLRERPELRTRLWDNVRRLAGHLERLERPDRPPSPVVPILLSNPALAVETWKELLERGIYLNLVLPPAAPNGISLLRLSLSAAHSAADIDQVGDALVALLGGVMKSSPG
ncbi:MAG: aminotransferase class I/II-fold pyridoxal phosphate-dependent enzyme [Planctomycetota bacterium]|nr:MAG: aminotransferase class I/II-fold pyridoxal phosphate-dependent enzyme [Planctomycetota bacterium]